MNQTGASTLYCAGLPLVGERDLTDDERAVLERERRLLRRRAGLLSLIPLLGLLPGMAIVTLLADTKWDGFFGITAFAVALAFAVVILVARDDFQISRAMRRGIRSGRLLCFGPPDGEQGTNAPQSTEDAEDGDEAAWSSIEILAGGNLLWRVNGEPADDRRIMETTAIPDPPDYAAMAADWAEPWTDADGRTTWWNQRNLSDPERAELHKHVRKAVWPYFMAPLMTAYLGVGLFTGDWGDSAWTFWFLTLFIVYMDWTAIRALPKLLHIRRDARLGKVAIFRRREPTGREAPGDVTEFLPFSRLPWTHDGQPAPWRKAARG